MVKANEYRVSLMGFRDRITQPKFVEVLSDLTDFVAEAAAGTSQTNVKSWLQRMAQSDHHIKIEKTHISNLWACIG